MPGGENKGKKLPAEPLRREEVEALLAACGTRGISGTRDRACIAVMWRCGLRWNEARHVRRCDLDLTGKVPTLRVMKPKGLARGARARTVRLDKVAIKYLGPWLEKRATLEQINGVNPLFCTRFGTIMFDGHFRAVLPRLARKAGIERRVHAHQLRHTYTYEVTMEGQPLIITSKVLGHASIVQTQHYADHLAPADLPELMGDRE